jgi:hypothetical protein
MAHVTVTTVYLISVHEIEGFLFRAIRILHDKWGTIFWSTVNNLSLSGEQVRPSENCCSKCAQEKPQQIEQEAELVSGSGQDGVYGIALLMREIVAAHAVLVLEMAEHRLDRRTSLHLA